MKAWPTSYGCDQQIRSQFTKPVRQLDRLLAVINQSEASLQNLSGSLTGY